MLNWISILPSSFTKCSRVPGCLDSQFISNDLLVSYTELYSPPCRFFLYILLCHIGVAPGIEHTNRMSISFQKLILTPKSPNNSPRTVYSQMVLDKDCVRCVWGGGLLVGLVENAETHIVIVPYTEPCSCFISLLCPFRNHSGIKLIAEAISLFSWWDLGVIITNGRRCVKVT